MGGFSFQGDSSIDVVDLGLGEGDVAWWDVGEVGSFGEEAAEDGVGVFYAAFFPGGVDVGVVDVGSEEAFEFVVVKEFAAVVGDDGFDGFEPAFTHEAAELTVDFGLGNSAEFADDVVACFTFDQDEDSAFTALL